MVLTKSLVGLGTVLLSAAGSQAVYTLQDTYDASNFFNEFEFFTASDPTGGFVKYVDASVANSTGLAGYSNGSVYMGVDHTTPNATGGRKSVRLTSKKAYTKGLVVMDATHLPVGCGTWPAFWMFGPNWPNSGEIDIIEGVNSQTTDKITMHTGPNCNMAINGSLASSTLSTTNCNAGNGDDGCSVTTANSQGYGAGFNAIGGGVYAMEWTDNAISVWFIPRTSGLIATVTGTGNATAPDPSAWGTPTVRFTPAGSGCDMSSHFKDMNIVFDITLCGQWAGQQAIWSADATCSALASTCNAYVASNPSGFNGAYFLVNSVKVYQDDGAAPTKRRSVRRFVA